MKHSSIELARRILFVIVSDQGSYHLICMLHAACCTQVMVRVIDMPLPAQVVLQVSFLPNNRAVLVLCDDGCVVLLSSVDAACKAALEFSSTERVRRLAHLHVW